MTDSRENFISGSEKDTWRSLGREKVFGTPIFELIKEDSLCLRTGASTAFYYFSCVDWVNVIALTPDNNIVMIKQYRHGSRRFELEIPGGGIDSRDGESPIDGGARELFEETGFKGASGRIIGEVCPNPALQGNICYTVLIENAEKVSEPPMEDTEDIESILLPAEKIGDLIKNGEIRHGLVLNALHFFDLYANKC